MEWLRSHPYLASLAGAGILLTMGSFVVQTHSRVAPTDAGLITWGGSLSGQAGYAPQTYAPGQTSANPGGINSGYISPIITTNTLGGEEEPFDFQAFMNQLTQVGASLGTPEGNASLLEAYSFIPMNNFSAEKSPAQMSADQRALYSFGNDIGGLIQGYESTHPDQPIILKNFAEDKSDSGKIQAMKQLGADLASVGVMIEEKRGIPTPAVSAAKALAASYKEIGAKLASVADARTDDDFVDRALIYNASAEVFVKNYVALALLFPAYDVSFGPDEPGSVFMLQQGGSF